MVSLLYLACDRCFCCRLFRMFRHHCSPDGGMNRTSILPLPPGSACGESARATEPCSQCVPSSGRHLGSHQRAGKPETLILGHTHSDRVHLIHDIIVCNIIAVNILCKVWVFFRLGTANFRLSIMSRWSWGWSSEGADVLLSDTQDSTHKHKLSMFTTATGFSAVSDLLKLRSIQDQYGFVYKIYFMMYIWS